MVLDLLSKITEDKNNKKLVSILLTDDLYMKKLIKNGGNWKSHKCSFFSCNTN